MYRYNVENGSTLDFLDASKSWVVVDVPDPAAERGATIEHPPTKRVAVEMDRSVSHLKTCIRMKEGVKQSQQRLRFKGVRLGDDASALADYGVEGGSALHLDGRGLSLAYNRPLFYASSQLS